MSRFYVALLCFCSFVYGDDFKQPAELRTQCQEAQEAERKMTSFEDQIFQLVNEERISAPVTRNIYNMLTGCFTLLFTIQRFHQILALSQENNKNDFVRASIIIKNFAAYFHNVSDALRKYGADRMSLRTRREDFEKSLDEVKKKYQDLQQKIVDESEKLASQRPENGIVNDIVLHIASKSETIEELDAELEAENTVGVLKNKRVSSELKIFYPVAGKIINDFGDKGINEQMIYYLGLETRYGAIVTAPVRGLVVFSGKFLDYNNMVIISNGEYRLFIYGIEKLFAAAGDLVEVGDYIGRMNDHSIDKPILKMELKKSGEPLDPRHWLETTLEKENKQ